MTPVEAVRLRIDFIQWDHVPVACWVPALQRWVETGTHPGGFLDAALRNDLRWAVINADKLSRRELFAWVWWLHDELPAECWGSDEIVAAWAAHRGAAGMGAAQDGSAGVAAARLRALCAKGGEAEPAAAPRPLPKFW
jgi:hypothetical protein